MKYLITSLLLMLCSLSSFSQHCIWAQNDKADSSDAEGAWDLEKHSSGDMLICGTWGLENAAPDTMIIGSFTFTSETPYSFFLARYDTSGHVIWAKTFPTEGILNNIFGCQCISDRQGNIYLVGTYSAKKIHLGATIFVNSDTTNPTTDAFIAKFTANGDLIWALPVSGTQHGNDYVTDVKTDANDDIYISGMTSSSVMHIDTNTYSITSPYIHENTFLSKLSQYGKVLWLKHPYGYGTGIISAMFTDARQLSYDNSNGILITGTYQEGSIAVGSDTLNNPDFVSYIIKYDTTGNVKWAHDIGSSELYTMASTCDNMGNTYVTGFFTKQSTSIGDFLLTNAGAEDSSLAMADIILAKYNQDGILLWAESFGTRADDIGTSITWDGSGHIIVGGRFGYGCLVFFGSSAFIHFGSMTFISADIADDMFVISLDAYTGQPINGFQLPCGGSAANLLADNIGSLYLTAPQWNINPLSIGPYNLQQTSEENFFVAKFNTELPMSIQPIWDTETSTITIYPNPSGGKITINTNLSPGMITFYSLSGQEILRKYLNEKVSTIDLSNLTKGVYLYRFANENAPVCTGRIIIQ